MTTPNTPALETRPAPVEAEIYPIEPPRVLVAVDGSVVEEHAAYIEPGTGEEIVVGRVVVKPAEQRTWQVGSSRERVAPTSAIEGYVGDAVVYDKLVPALRREKKTNALSDIPAAERTECLSWFRAEAARCVLTHLGVSAEDLQPPSQKRRRR